MTAIQDFGVVVASDADGGLRLSLVGEIAEAETAWLNEAIVSGIRAGVPRIEVDLRAVTSLDGRVAAVLSAGRALAAKLEVEFRVTGTGLHPA